MNSTSGLKRGELLGHPLSQWNSVPRSNFVFCNGSRSSRICSLGQGAGVTDVWSPRFRTPWRTNYVTVPWFTFKNLLHWNCAFQSLCLWRKIKVFIDIDLVTLPALSHGTRWTVPNWPTDIWAVNEKKTFFDQTFFRFPPIEEQKQEFCVKNMGVWMSFFSIFFKKIRKSTFGGGKRRKKFCFEKQKYLFSAPKIDF